MPATRQALRVTEAYRNRISTLTRATQRQARTAWRDVDFQNLRGSYGPVRARVERDVRAAQAEAVRATAGYVGAFLTAELGEHVDPPYLLSLMYVGRSFGGLALFQSLQKPLTTTLVAVRDGKPDPMGLGLQTLLVNVDLDVKNAARSALMDAVTADPRITGWQRAIRGTCGACAAAATGPTDEASFEVHPGCQCMAEPVVEPKGPQDVVKRPMPAVRSSTEPMTPAEIPASHPVYSLEEMQAVQEYVGTTQSFSVNGMLRRGTSSPGYEAITRNIDSAMDKAGPLGQATRTFRSLRLSPEDLGMETGTTFTEKAFSSTSATKDVGGVNLTPVTRLVMNVDPRVQAVWGANPLEEELLLERGCRYVIRSVEKDGETWNVTVEVLPPETRVPMPPPAPPMTYAF